MKAYKFRTTQNFEFVADILVNRRFYCSDPRSFNDIREGDIRVGDDRGAEIEVIDFGNRVSDALGRCRVTSLCKTFDNHLLWAYYAGGFTGMAIEVELPSADIVEVTYDDYFIYLSDYCKRNDVEGATRAALCKKYTVWRHEQEVRIITPEPFYDLRQPISRVIVGPRVSQPMINVLHIICSHYGISLDRAVIADWGIYTVGAQVFV